MAGNLVTKLLDRLIYVHRRQSECRIKVVTGVERDLARLCSALRELGEVLNRAERRKLKDKSVGLWVEMIEDFAFEMEDVLDEWNAEIHKRQTKVPQDQDINRASSLTFWDTARSFFITYCLCCIQFSVDSDIAPKIRDLNNRLEEIFNEANRLFFLITFLYYTSGEITRPLSTSIFNESEIRGRKNDKDVIVKELLSANDNNIHIVSIVGMAGIGKTSLAQFVFNDDRVMDHFELRAWICVSNPFDPEWITRSILQALGESSPRFRSFERELTYISLLISRKKFLLVLDDVWNDDYCMWEPIWRSLKNGNPESRILVTTRGEHVAIMMRTYSLYSLGPLPDSECWSILSRIAFSGRSQRESEKLEEIGFEISRKCKGLPLVAVFLGNLLRSRDTVEQWQNILESEIWDLEGAATHLFPSIYMSYDEFSSEMKRCFLYCAVFPEDFPLDVAQLIRLWSAQGFINSSGGVGESESGGYEYFLYLARHSFFEVLERDPYLGRIIKCKMHGIIHDFAQHLVNGKCLSIKNFVEAIRLSSRKVRHLTWFRGDVSIIPMASNAGNLRSFCSFNGINIAPDVFYCLRRVRTLSLHGAWLEEVPRAVGKLIHLRYLDLSRNNYLKELPEEICDLYHLETLDITDCPKVTQLPRRVGNLVNLRHLLNYGTNIKQGLEKLTSLRVLKELKVGEGYNKLECLRSLYQLEGEINIEFFGEDDAVNFENARLRDKTFIQGLVLMFYESVVEVSELPPNLEYLSIYFYTHSLLPTCIMSHNNLRRLDIAFGNVSSLSALGKLPSLEILQLFALSDVEVLGHEFLGITEYLEGLFAFPRLKKLKFSRLQNLRTWEDLGEGDESLVSFVMPCLQELHLYECHELKMLPHLLLGRAPALEVLNLHSCTALAKRYNRFGDGWNHVSHIPNVLIDGSRQVQLAC